MYIFVCSALRCVACAALFAASACIGFGTTVVPLGFDELVDFSERVVRGTVVKTRCEWRSSADSRFIVTIVTIRVDETVLGPDDDTVELHFLGGQLDGKTLEVAGQPVFEIGDEEILFVKGNGESICPLVGMFYGRMLLVPNSTGRLVVARSNGAPVQSLGQLREPINDTHVARALTTAQSSKAMSADDFCEAIRSHALRQGRPDIVTQ